MKLHIFYRLSDKGGNKERLNSINNKVCLDNFIKEFPVDEITIIADNVKDDTIKWLETYNFKSIQRTNLGNSGSFWFSFCLALKLPYDDYVYFVENDYIHKTNSMGTLFEGLKIADYVTLYDHPDKYIDGINPQIKNGGERTKVFLTRSSHWKITNSTTMTFASKVSVLKQDSFVFKFFTVGIVRGRGLLLNKFGERQFPNDYRIFYVLLKFKKRLLISPIPGISTHSEVEYLSPLVDWESILLPVK